MLVQRRLILSIERAFVFSGHWFWLSIFLIISIALGNGGWTYISAMVFWAWDWKFKIHPSVQTCLQGLALAHSEAEGLTPYSLWCL